jgi:hypothetical protein
VRELARIVQTVLLLLPLCVALSIQLSSCEVDAGEDSEEGGGDAGAGDDGGEPDSGSEPVDGGDTDASSAPVDGGDTDASSDASVEDGGYEDAGFTDGGLTDGGYDDAGSADSGYADGGYRDAGYVDAGYSDGGYYDGGYSDGGYGDGGYYDGGYYDGGGYVGSTSDSVNDCEGSSEEAVDCDDPTMDIVGATVTCGPYGYEIRIDTASTPEEPVEDTRNYGCTFRDAELATQWISVSCDAYGPTFGTFEATATDNPGSTPITLSEGEGCFIDGGQWVFTILPTTADFTIVEAGCSFSVGTSIDRQTDFLHGLNFGSCD